MGNSIKWFVADISDYEKILSCLIIVNADMLYFRILPICSETKSRYIYIYFILIIN